MSFESGHVASKRYLWKKRGYQVEWLVESRFQNMSDLKFFGVRVLVGTGTRAWPIDHRSSQ